MILQNSRTIPGQMALFQIPGVFQDQGQIQGLSRSVLCEPCIVVTIHRRVAHKSLSHHTYPGFIQASLSKIQGLFKAFQKASPTVFKD